MKSAISFLFFFFACAQSCVSVCVFSIFIAAIPWAKSNENRMRCDARLQFPANEISFRSLNFRLNFCSSVATYFHWTIINLLPVVLVKIFALLFFEMRYLVLWGHIPFANVHFDHIEVGKKTPFFHFIWCVITFSMHCKCIRWNQISSGARECSTKFNLLFTIIHSSCPFRRFGVYLSFGSVSFHAICEDEQWASLP